MSTPSLPSLILRRWIGPALGLGLAVAACAPATPAATLKPTAAVVTAPTKAPAQPTAAPTKAAPTAAPTVAPTKAPTAAPKPTVAPTTQPTTAAPTAAASPQPTAAAPAKLGKMQAAGDLEITPSQMKTLTTIGTVKPKTGDVFWEITVDIHNTSKVAELPFDPAMLTLVDPATGTKITAAALKSVSGELTVQALKPGASVTGVVIFEVTAKAAGLELQFDNSHQQALWTLSG